MELKPNKSEEVFLNLAYERFHALHDEIMNDEFWEQDVKTRFCKVSSIFAVYTELSSYMPIGILLETDKLKGRSDETRAAGVIFRFLCDIFSKFPFFASWNEVWVSRMLVNWKKEGSSVDKFLQQFSGHEEVGYRHWDSNKKCIRDISLFFPQHYSDSKIYLTEFLSEKDGVMFSVTMMWQILNSQVQPEGRRA